MARGRLGVALRHAVCRTREVDDLSYAFELEKHLGSASRERDGDGSASAGWRRRVR